MIGRGAILLALAACGVDSRPREYSCHFTYQCGDHVQAYVTEVCTTDPREVEARWLYLCQEVVGFYGCSPGECDYECSDEGRHCVPEDAR